MSKKFGKFLLFTAVAGAAAYGAYHYLQTKDDAPASNKNEDTDDDFDDFSEDLDDDAEDTKDRSYVSLNLDKAEAIASEAFQKAKEVIADSVQQVKDTVKSVAENQTVSDSNFTDLTALNKPQPAEAENSQETFKSDNVQPDDSAAGEEADAAPKASPISETISAAADTATEKIEEFFDDDL